MIYFVETDKTDKKASRCYFIGFVLLTYYVGSSAIEVYNMMKYDNLHYLWTTQVFNIYAREVDQHCTRYTLFRCLTLAIHVTRRFCCVFYFTFNTNCKNFCTYYIRYCVGLHTKKWSLKWSNGIDILLIMLNVTTIINRMFCKQFGKFLWMIILWNSMNDYCT